MALIGETSAGLRLLEKGDVIAYTPSQVAISSGRFDHVDVTVGHPLKTMAATEECAKYRPAHCR